MCNTTANLSPCYVPMYKHVTIHTQTQMYCIPSIFLLLLLLYCRADNRADWAFSKSQRVKTTNPSPI